MGTPVRATAYQRFFDCRANFAAVIRGQWVSHRSRFAERPHKSVSSACTTILVVKRIHNHIRTGIEYLFKAVMYASERALRSQKIFWTSNHPLRDPDDGVVHPWRTRDRSSWQKKIRTTSPSNLERGGITKGIRRRADMHSVSKLQFEEHPEGKVIARNPRRLALLDCSLYLPAWRLRKIEFDRRLMPVFEEV
jgi:hypothetical protein